jgi:type I restriction-modification system DNA methylase subunit
MYARVKSCVERIPTGIFYAQGVKANMLFFDKRQPGPEPQTKQLWVYDLCTNMNFTLRTNPLRRTHLDDFVNCYCPGKRHQRQESERFRCFRYEELLKRDKLSLDLFWLRDESLEGTDKLLPPARSQPASSKTCKTHWSNLPPLPKIWEGNQTAIGVLARVGTRSQKPQD